MQDVEEELSDGEGNNSDMDSVVEGVRFFFLMMQEPLSIEALCSLFVKGQLIPDEARVRQALHLGFGIVNQKGSSVDAKTLVMECAINRGHNSCLITHFHVKCAPSHDTRIVTVYAKCHVGQSNNQSTNPKVCPERCNPERANHPHTPEREPN